jgi:hypothetical protein
MRFRAAGSLNPNSRAILAILVEHETAGGFSFLHAGLLSELTNIPLDSIRRACRQLSRANLAQYGHGGYAAMEAGREWLREHGQ